MKKDILEKANDIQQGIKCIDRVLGEYEKSHWVSFSTPRDKDLNTGNILYNDLKEFLIKKKTEYEKVFESL